MGCGTSKAEGKSGAKKEPHAAAPDNAPLVPSQKTRTPDLDAAQGSRKPVSFGWGRPGSEVVVDPQDAGDPPFLQTAAPSGTTWGQYVRTRSSFVDPKTGFLAGPWAECIAWAVVFEHMADWDKMPQYPQDGVVGPVLEKLEEALRRRPLLDKAALVQAVDKLEDAAHELAEFGRPMPDIRQVVLVPRTDAALSLMRFENPQAPGSHVMVKVPPMTQPEQPLLVPVPVQPSKSGELHSGKVPFSIGSLPGVAPRTRASTALYGDTEGDVPSECCMGEFDGEAVQDPSFLESLF